MHDLLDRHATAWHRIWITFSGLWLAVLAPSLPGPIDAVLAVIAWSMVAAAVGLVELAMAVWYRYLREPARDRWPSLVVGPAGRSPSAEDRSEQPVSR